MNINVNQLNSLRIAYGVYPLLEEFPAIEYPDSITEEGIDIPYNDDSDTLIYSCTINMNKDTKYPIYSYCAFYSSFIRFFNSNSFKGDK